MKEKEENANDNDESESEMDGSKGEYAGSEESDSEKERYRSRVWVGDGFAFKESKLTSCCVVCGVTLYLKRRSNMKDKKTVRYTLRLIPTELLHKYV